MRLNVNPTRMEMQRLKKSLVLARRGWKMLKDKQDELMRIFLEKKDVFFKLYRKCNENMREILSLAIAGNAFLSGEKTSHLASLSGARLFLEAGVKNIFNLRVPDFHVKYSGKAITYKSAESVVYWDKAVEKAAALLPDIIAAGALLFEIQALCIEIASTRRRVNALEYIMIPNITETVKYINFKLEEMERANTVRLMKIKEIVRSH
ncbi:MAG: V-type ATP synthase subunit D [Candidatus Omnitrophota bacterium]|nr:V-type ATP synthase subunit D [Candidatus Omnitrophota bacterium]MBU3929937.1 V-type ATP synthase subunit D [bacterium]MBU4122661.1 V-type ATP synthase subunit D [bacterium]